MNNVVRIAQQGDYSDRQLDLINRTVASDCNAQEFDLFCEVARRTGLDPFRKQISAIVFSKDDPQKRKMSIITNIDGLRAIAARSGRYRPDEDEAEYVYDDTLKGDDNPLGLVKATVTIHIADSQRDGGWRPVKGWAYWEEFAPIKEGGEGGEEWVENGVHPPGHKKAGQPRYRKQPIGKMVRKLDTSGNWGKMPRVMIAKCAEAQAIRKAFPEDTSGLYEGAELDRARADEFTASERIEAFHVDNRLAQVGAANSIMMAFSPAAGIEPVPLGQAADRCFEAIRDADLRLLDWFEKTNTHPLREFWARSKPDALAVKQAIDNRRKALVFEQAAD